MKRYILLVVSLVTLSCSFLHAQQVLKGRNGNIVVKKDSLLRAMTAFTSPATGGSWYSEAVNAYQEALGDNVQVYSMIVLSRSSQFATTSSHSKYV